jgi:hypothetical protein
VIKMQLCVVFVCVRARVILGLRSCLYLVQATSAEFGLSAGHTRFNTQIDEWISVRNIMCIIVSLYFYISCVIKN